MGEEALDLRIILIRQGLLRGSIHFVLILLKEILINGNLWRCQGRRCDKLQGRVANKLTSEPQEGLLEVVVRLG
jgi:hypothetical protein